MDSVSTIIIYDMWYTQITMDIVYTVIPDIW